MKKLLLVILVIVALSYGNISGIDNQAPSTNFNVSNSQDQESLKTKPNITNKTCDGVSTTTNCELEGIKYASYIFHAAMPEKSHDEIVTTYIEEVSGYCTLCSDGTYSPSCATGRGACSHHGGVAQWNAPVHRKVPQYTTKKVIDVAAQEAYYQKVVQ